MEWRPLKVWVKSIYSTTGIMEDYSDKYIVSDNGIIKDILSQKEIKYTVPKEYPYKTVELIDKNGKKHKRLVHRIVASTYPDICGELNEVVNHLDENKLNNSAKNLRWCTEEENKNYGTAKERAKINYYKAMAKRKALKEEMRGLNKEESCKPILESIEYTSFFYKRKK